MAAPPTYPCLPYANQTHLCSPYDDYALDSALMNDFLEMASSILFYATAQQYNGECVETIRPCTSRTLGMYWPFPNPINISGRWYDGPGGSFYSACGCSRPNRCSCGSLAAIELPRSPIVDVTQVKIDGVILAASKYRVDAYSQLVRTDGNSWPTTQDLSKAATEDDTFEVRYLWGRDAPSILVHATATLAGELYMSCNPEAFSGQCRLPRNIASIARQGVTVDFRTMEGMFSPRKGRPIYFGIPEIDMALAVLNPFGLTGPSVILSPDEGPLGRLVDT